MPMNWQRKWIFSVSEPIDLTQYTLAIDRQNAKLDMFYDSHHPAVLKMIQMVIDSAHKEGIWAGICGELGADTTLTEQFVAMGIERIVCITCGWYFR